MGKSLQEAILSTTKADDSDGNVVVSVQLAVLGSYVTVAGEIEDETEDIWTSWKIKHSTDPGLVGCNLVGTSTTPLCCSTLTAKGASNSNTFL